MWLILGGSVSVRLTDSKGTGRRIASLGRGTTVGEMALIESGVRSADIIADDVVDCFELSRESFLQILTGEPVIASKLLINLGKETTRRLRLTSRDLWHGQ